MSNWKKLDGQFNALRTLYADDPSDDSHQPATGVAPNPQKTGLQGLATPLEGIKTPWSNPKGVTTRKKR